MLTSLHAQPEDKILALMGMFRADDRPNKIDLGVGVYKNAEGQTPIMHAVKNAEKQLWEQEQTKSYTGLIGDAGYHKAMSDMVLGGVVDADRLAFAHTPGGTGAIRQIMELVKMADTGATIWLSDPTWANHPSIIKHVGLPQTTYTYFDNETRSVNFDGMMDSLQGVKSGDVVLLHGCCHNPTGANLNNEQWALVADLLLEKGAIPFVDIAYQGFGDGLEEDAYGTRLLAQKFPEMLIAASCSKNFGIYRERAGIVIAISPDAAASKITQANLSYLNRQNFSFPPDHGARLVTMVLTDDALRAEWKAELESVRTGMLNIRQMLADALRAESGSDRFGFLAEHRGMFSRVGATPEQVQKLREEHAIYMVGDSRMNIAGITEKTVPILAKAIIAVGV
ncbi:aromatic amino acid aminotransferase [Amylibacter ulvae]|uniref:Aminotransferase n=1 Tax=Paramylibacter ulvae TaxID=1651968 RepID=A0ABQ3D9C3_9RHOB|nr:amino acid aminotransferase [Amylibacter ulvae]GHA59615.1 aromatic amino acid aminotransferase [Amylibacter ulvae]